MAGSQDMFDAIVMADERFHGEGYQEGYEEGSSLGLIEGRQHGTLHGARIGSEIGCYQGFAFAWRCLLHGCATEKDRIRHHRCFFAAPAAPPVSPSGELGKSVARGRLPARPSSPQP
ncbi:protein LTO1 homolog isoform X2 [Mustela lutreola]|uniref:protein LTO1 homolog isoform X2 n=1 Tax=Mustela lutreola TaxID=9666 RepID=UPI0027979831|nr:protein LTO1 homolog isoform X2 [Mustela lutreola]